MNAKFAPMVALIIYSIGLSCPAQTPPGPPDNPKPADHPRHPSGYSLEQAVSDRAQRNTIAFDGLAFLTGDFSSDTFLPPGKVADFFGFQYMRDIEPQGGGHNTSFLTRIAFNVLANFSDEQKAQLVALARQQEPQFKAFAYKRFPLIKAFCRQADGDIPAGSASLDRQAVMKYSADLFELDGQLAFDRAKVVGSIVRSLNDNQKAAFATLKFGDSKTFPDIPEERALDKRGMPHDVHVLVMTYASEFFSWYAGSVDADTYFCPERHGTYFGSFFMKDAPAMHKQNYSISTTLTGNSGEAFLNTLTAPQRKLVEDLVDLQRKDIEEIVKTRRAISVELRKFMQDDSPKKETVLALSRRYGELDGEISFLYATHFAQVAKTLTADQKASLLKLRNLADYKPRGAFVYSDPVDMPQIPNTDFLFGLPSR